MEVRGLGLVSVLALAVVASGCAGGSNSSDLVAEGNTLLYELQSASSSQSVNISLTFTDVSSESYSVNMSASSELGSESRTFSFSRDNMRVDSMDSVNEESLLYVMPLQTFSSILNLSESDISSVMEDGEAIEVSANEDPGTISRSEEFSYQGRSAYNITLKSEGSQDSVKFTVSSESPYPMLHFGREGALDVTLKSVEKE